MLPRLWYLLIINIILVISYKVSFLWNNSAYITHIHTYWTLKIYIIILKMCFLSSIQNFLINIFIFYRNWNTIIYGNTVKILKQTFGYYGINNRRVGIKLGSFKVFKKSITVDGGGRRVGRRLFGTRE